MSIHERLYATSATQEDMKLHPVIDVGGILLRLLLFEHYILKSTRLCEIPKMVELLGLGQTLVLLRSGAFEIYIDAVTTVETGRLTTLRSREVKGALPLGSYCFQTVSIPDRREYVSGCFRQWIDPMPFGVKSRQKLKHALLDVAREAPQDIGRTTITGLRKDLLAGGPLVTRAVSKITQEKIGRAIHIDDLRIQVEVIDDEDIAVETNLGRLLGADEQTVHDIVQRAFLNISGLNQRLAEMKEFNALSGFQTNDLPLFEEKVTFIVQGLDPDRKLERASRVFSVLNLPDFSGIGVEYKLDVDQFLKVRSSQECQEFRAWLPSIDQSSDAEIRERVSSLNARVAEAMNTKPGKVIRFLTTTGLGLVPGAGIVLGPAASAADTFVVDRLLKKSGIVTFVGKMYPALFEPLDK
ncbi:MAG: hypothetical protein IME95_02010 [Proteobacteria bacterium]|jgi:hypothetical protein|nr:hypothetical protein [Pseudomonadota bacterium]